MYPCAPHNFAAKILINEKNTKYKIAFIFILERKYLRPQMREPLLPMTIPAFAAHVANVELMYSDNKYYELCGQMGHLIGPSGIGKD